jgi:predicted acyl esterase
MSLVSLLIFAATLFASPRDARAQQSPPAAQSNPQQTYEVVIQTGARMETRDGVTLRADIYRPKAEGKFPVILMRTPYDKSVGWAAAPAYQVAAHGYVMIVQDVRGRYTSEGEFYTFRHEIADGYDAVEWAAAPTSARPKCSPPSHTRHI